LSKLTCLGPNKETNKKELAKILEDRDALRLKMADLKQERQTLQDKLASVTRTMESLKTSSTGNQQVNELQVRGVCGYVSMYV